MGWTAPIPVDERRRAIGEALEEPEEQDFVLFRGAYVQRPVVTLPLELPVYRTDNGRVAIEEMEYVRTHDLARDFFRRGQESAEAQAALHDILLRLSLDKKGPIYHELARLAQQTEPLLLTADGIVVNGNRRLAAMRALYDKDPARYAGFARVKATVLPDDATVADIEAIEAALQMAPETKLAYGWAHRRLKLRRQRDELQLPVETICDSYRLRSPKQLHREIAELELAEEYLADYLRRPRDYEAVADTEELFTGLYEQLQHLSGKAHTTWKLAGFRMIQVAEQLPNHPKLYFPFVAPKPPYAPPLVLGRFGFDEGIWPPDAHPPEGHESSTQSELDEEDYERLIAYLSRSKDARHDARTLTRLFDQVQLEQRERATPKRVTKKLREASDMMARIDLDVFDGGQLRALRGHLVQIDYHARELLAQADARVKREPSNGADKKNPKLRKLARDPLGYVADAYMKRRTKRGG